MDRGLGELWNTWMIGVFVTFIRVVYGRMIYMFLPGSRPGAGWLQALYRNLPFLPVVSWNPGKKTNVISPAPMRWWRMHYNSVHLLFMSCCSYLGTVSRRICALHSCPPIEIQLWTTMALTDWSTTILHAIACILECKDNAYLFDLVLLC